MLQTCKIVPTTYPSITGNDSINKRCYKRNCLIIIVIMMTCFLIFDLLNDRFDKILVLCYPCFILVWLCFGNQGCSRLATVILIKCFARRLFFFVHFFFCSSLTYFSRKYWCTLRHSSWNSTFFKVSFLILKRSESWLYLSFSFVLSSFCWSSSFSYCLTLNELAEGPKNCHEGASVWTKYSSPAFLCGDGIQTSRYI